MKRIILSTAFVLALPLCAARADANKQAPLVVHEWGTFTSLQDEKGNAIPGINTDDEPVPSFVHRLGFNLIAPQRTFASDAPAVAPMYASKIAPVSHCDPDVLARLETPVIYFYPPKGWKPQAVDVHVSYPGGWLSEFYPNAVSKAPGFAQGGMVGHLSKDTTGELTWSGLIVGASDGAMPDTTSKVWLAPRAVKSALVTENSESEKFLFYRGVGNVEAPLRVSRNEGFGLDVRDNDCVKSASLPIHAAWLVDVRANGACAFKSIGAINAGQGVRATLPGSFGEEEYSANNMTALRAEMRVSLVNEGLFADEADALLNTWQVSYFQNPGLRFFYMCPRPQIDTALPLQISAPSEISRVMIGRIEIVTAEQRTLLKEIASGAPVAKQNQDYTLLGRFRNALVLDEQKQRPTAGLDEFISRNSLGAYIVAPQQPMAKSGIFGWALVAASAAMLALRFLMKAGRKLLRRA